MKKKLLIISSIILILLFNIKVKAASVIDGTYTRGVQITTTSTNNIILTYNNTSTTLTFPQSFSNTNDDYIMIPYMGLVYFQLDNFNNQNYFTILPDYEQYIRVSIQSNWNRRNCEIADGYITCPIEKNSSFTKLYFDTVIPDTWTDGYWKFDITLPTYADVYKKSQTAIIDNQNQNTQEIINQNATYEENPEELNGTTELNEYTQKEEQLFGNLDFDVNGTSDITINPNASAFVWQIVEALRGMNPAIILLMTSILGIGIIKLILNR